MKRGYGNHSKGFARAGGWTPSGQTRKTEIDFRPDRLTSSKFKDGCLLCIPSDGEMKKLPRVK